MKYLKLLLLLFLASPAIAQQQDIEVRLSLVHQAVSKTPNELTLIVSVLNHSKQDIYIPSFSNFAAYAGIHFYEKVGQEWKEFDIITHDYYKAYTAKKIGSVTYHDDPNTYFTNNTVSRLLKDSVAINARFQDDILRNAARAVGQERQWTVGNTPLFLKAKQEVKYFSVLDLSYLLTKGAEYKISFNTEARDTLYGYRDSVSKDIPPSRRFPLKVNGFKRIQNETLGSNTLYLSTLFIDDKKSRK